MAKAGQISGFTKGLSVAARMAEITDLFFKLKIKEEKLYKDEGFKSWDAYCRATYGVSANVMDHRLETIKELGPEIMKIMHSVNMRPQQLALLLSENQKAQLRKGTLAIGDRKIEVKAENAADIQAAVDALIKESTKGIKALTKAKDAQNRTLTDLTAIKEKYERLYPEDDLHFVRDNRPVHSAQWEAFLDDFRAFALNDRAVGNSEAHAYVCEVYDRILGNLSDLNEEYRQRTGGQSFIRERK